MKQVNKDDIIQLNDNNPPFKYCLAVVSEVRPWGVICYVQNAGVDGQAYVRVEWDNFELTGGKAFWVAE
jgi:hypothetical protein